MAAEDDGQFPSARIANDLQARIATGEFAPGSRLPSARSLAEEYRCALNTAQAAVRILEDRHLVSIRPKVGATVAQEPGWETPDELSAIASGLQEVQQTLSTATAQLVNLAERIAAVSRSRRGQ